MFSRVYRYAVFVLLILSLTFVGNAFAKEVRTTVRGYAPTYKDAVIDALQSAVSQVMGVSIDVKEVSALTTSVEHKVNGDKEALTNSLSKSSAKGVALDTRGVISSYQILDRSIENGMHRVDVEVVIEKYETPGPKNNRRKLAVMGFFGDVDSDFLRDVTQTVVTGFTQGRKFIMLERQYRAVSGVERTIWASETADVKEKAKLGRELGADYVIFGVVRDLDVRSETNTLAVTGESKTFTKGQCVVDYRILVPATNQIKWSDSVSVKLTEERSSNVKETKRQLAQEAGTRIVRQTMSNIYPPRVIKVSGNNITINQGGKTVAVNDRFTVYKLGAKLKDSYTGESLGREEIPAATVRITTVNAKFSVAQIIDGNPRAILVNSILRRAAPQTKMPETSVGRETAVKTDNNGGVKLPFD
jgi:hypothetical protein